VDPVSVAIVVKDRSLRQQVAGAFDSAPPAWGVSFYEGAPADADVVVVDDSQSSGVVFDPRCPERLIPEVQAHLDRSLRAAAPSRAVAVTGLPGTGVSSIAIHLASSWAARFETCYVDLDRSWSCAHRLGLGDEVVSWAEAEPSSEGLRLASVPIERGLRALVAPLTPAEVRIDNLVDSARSEWQRLVVDLPFRAREPSLTDRLDAMILVLAPCLPHAHRVAQILPQFGTVPVVIVTNRLGRGGETTRAQIESVIGRKVGLELPCYPGLRDAEGKQRLAPLRWSRWGRGVSRLSRALDR
jgi:hypothetical protein